MLNLCGWNVFVDGIALPAGQSTTCWSCMCWSSVIDQAVELLWAWVEQYLLTFSWPSAYSLIISPAHPRLSGFGNLVSTTLS